MKSLKSLQYFYAYNCTINGLVDNIILAHVFFYDLREVKRVKCAFVDGKYNCTSNY